MTVAEQESTSEEFDPHAGRALDRLINFTDAIVAVAITVLVLPLADLAISPQETSVWAVLGDHSGQIITFLFTFFVVAVMWKLHNRIFNQLVTYDMPIFWLNLVWVAVIVFLPVSSTLYGEGRDGGTSWSAGNLNGASLLYWLSLASISGIGTIIGWHVRRNPQLMDPRVRAHAEASDWRARYRGIAYSSYFILIGVVSTFAPEVAAWMPIGIIPLGRVMRAD